MPDRISSTVCQVAAYPAGSMFAHASAASVAASRTAALPVSVRRNRRSGVSSRRAHTVRSENCDTGAADSVTPGFSRAPRQLTISAPVNEREVVLADIPGSGADSRNVGQNPRSAAARYRWLRWLS